MHIVAGDGFIGKQYSIRIVINVASIVYLLTIVCNKYIIDCDLLVNFLWNLHSFAGQLSKGANYNQNSNELHRMQKVVLLIFKELLVNFVNSDLIVTRFVCE